MRRAIILVPGFKRAEKHEARDRLVNSILHYSDGWETSLQGDGDSNSSEAVSISATGRSNEGTTQLSVYEAYWADLIPDFAEESAMTRFRRGTQLLGYWTIGGALKALVRKEYPRRAIIGLSAAALMLFFWYVVVTLLLITAFAQGGVSVPAAFLDIQEIKDLHTRALEIAETFSNWPIVLFIIGLFGLGRIDGIASIASFAKAYLQDNCFQGSDLGIRAKTRQRVIALLDDVHSQTGKDAFDEVYVVAHSLGGPIAIDALAEYGERLTKTTLVTWGTALGLLVQQEPQIEDEIRKLYTSTDRIRNWVDVVFKSDFLASKAPIPLMKTHAFRKARYAQIFPDTVEPTLPKGYSRFSSRTHDGYYSSSVAIQMLVQPHGKLPQPKANEAQVAALFSGETMHAAS